MLLLEDLAYSTPEGKKILEKLSFRLPPGHFNAVVGPSGCGKSTLLKLVGGVHEEASSGVFWAAPEKPPRPLGMGETGYVPQFSILEEKLTVSENIAYALRLRVAGLSGSEEEARVAELAEAVGLRAAMETRCLHLSGGQRRRLSLACELVNNPMLLLCDEVTSGLDLHSEDEIVRLLASIAHDQGRLVMCVTHSFRHMDLFDSVTFLYQGRLIYHGSAEGLQDYFGRPTIEEVFNVLHEHEAEVWEEHWQSTSGARSGGFASRDGPGQDRVRHPGVLSQAWCLLGRRFRLFGRDGSQMALQFSLLVVFPLLVCVFGYQGMPGVRNVDMALDGSMLEQIRQNLEYNLQLGKIGTLVSGLVLFQAILLSLMGANNASREVVACRLPFEKEKLGGVRAESQLLAAVVFLSGLVGLQALWMTFLVKVVCGLPGLFSAQFVVLLLLNGAMTSLSLAISSWARTTEQASLLSVYAVGFQLPLSGAVLALPHLVGEFVRPFISTYWAWSAYLQTMKDTRYYDLAAGITNTPVADFGTGCIMLGLHIVIGLVVAYAGMLRSRWQ